MKTAILLLLAVAVLAGTVSAGFDKWTGMPEKTFENGWDFGNVRINASERRKMRYRSHCIQCKNARRSAIMANVIKEIAKIYWKTTTK
jgi:hypothetical protein